MAIFSTTAITSNPTKLPLFFSFSISCTPFYTFSNTTNSIFFPFASHRPLQPLSFHSTVVRPGRCHAASPGPPPPPRTDPPPGNDPRQLKGLATSLSKTKDRVQIFFAVLFWMSLFFWASARDRRNRPNKGSRFRK